MEATEMPVMKKIKELENALSSSTIVVGWVDGNGSAAKAYAHLQAKKATGKNQHSVGKPASKALIARTLNYGRQEGTTAEGRHYPAIPARPFMDFAKEIFDRVFPKVMGRYMNGYLSGVISIDALLTAIGDRAKSAVQEAILNGDYVPLSPKTIAAKGSSVPLIDTGEMLRSVTFEIRRA
jgi:hypothetical protein